VLKVLLNPSQPEKQKMCYIVTKTELTKPRWYCVL